MKVNDIVDVLAAQGNFKTNRMLFESSLYYYGAILLNIMNIKKKNGSSINFYGITFSGSGTGKDFALSTVAKAVDIDDKEYSMNMRKALSKNIGLHGSHGVHEPKEIEDLINGLPLSVRRGLDGTREGIFKTAKSQSISNYGAFNVDASEFGDIVNNSSDLLNSLKELYDGEYKAKVIKSENVAAIKDITVNLMAFGSRAGLDSQAQKQFKQFAESGIYRRSFIIDLKPCEAEKNTDVVDMTEVSDYLSSIKERVMYSQNSIMMEENHNLWDFPLDISDDANVEIDLVKDYLLDLSNSNIYSDEIAAERGAFQMIENLAYIIAFLEDRKVVESCDVLAAFDFFKRCRATTVDIFRQRSDFELIYEMVERYPGITMSEMMSMSKEVPQHKVKFKDQIDVVKEMCYIRNNVLEITGNNVERYSIKTLPLNDNSMIIVGVSNENSKYPTLFNSYEIPFFGEKRSVETMVTSPDVSAFSTTHFEPKGKADIGYRSLENCISGQNLIAFDIDDGMTLEEAKEKLSEYTYIIYTTKSHQVDKGGTICDRFRILLPTKTEFYVSTEQHKELYENVSKFLGIESYDKATRDQSRLWFTSPSGTVYKNVAQNIDVSFSIPETKAAKKFAENMDTLAANYGSQVNESINGFMKWFFANTSQGNRNDHLFRLGKFMKDLGEDATKYIEDWNAMLDVPLSEKDVSVICKSVMK